MTGGRVAVALLVGAVALAGCSGDDGDDGDGAAATTAATAPATSAAGGSPSTTAAPATAADADAVLVVENYTFAPLTVPAGSVVKLENRDAEPHTISSPDGSISFDGETETFTAPATAGTYSYVCGVHAFMEGTLTVT